MKKLGNFKFLIIKTRQQQHNDHRSRTMASLTYTIRKTYANEKQIINKSVDL
ncbi:hypothetical protein LguiA_019269 [Lonicera macranthoides]